MRNAPDQSDTHETADSAALMLFLAGELPEAEHQAMQRRLAEEPALRAELGAMTEAQETIGRALSALDQAQPLPGSAAASYRKIARSIRQWQTDRVVQEPVAIHKRARWTWVHTTATAASLLVAFTLWRGLRPTGNGLASGSGTANLPGMVDGVATPTNMVAAAPNDPIADDRGVQELEKDLQVVANLRSMTELNE